MAEGIDLLEEEKDMKKELEEMLDKLKEDLEKKKLNFEQRKELISQMGDVAHNLHISLKDRGYEPIHHKYMIENRGMPSDHPDFYKHIHPVEDLLKYINDVDANKDPEDQTLDVKFYFNIFTRRWGHRDRYSLTRIQGGWFFEHLMYSGECDKGGSPYLFEALKHDSVNYPEDLGGYLEWLWERAKEDGLSQEEVQSALDELADWVSLTESNSPAGIFKGYK